MGVSSPSIRTMGVVPTVRRQSVALTSQAWARHRSTRSRAAEAVTAAERGDSDAGKAL
jgi:hypothetical protein